MKIRTLIIAMSMAFGSRLVWRLISRDIISELHRKLIIGFYVPEDLSGEYPVEEDYWVAAIEYADSVGADVVNTSLYYTGNRWPFPSHEYEEMDGKTALPTRAANVAANKGIFIACCAGNDGSWVGTPADSPNVLAVGSVTTTGGIGDFYGIWYDC